MDSLPSLSVDVSNTALSRRDGFQFGVKILRADLGNFFLYEHRKVDGFLITAKNSGTHWLRHMLSHAMAHQYGLKPPAYASGETSNSIVGHPNDLRLPPGVPRIGSSHTIPSCAFGWRWLNRLAPHKPVALLVRNLESAMLSHYVKWRETYGVSLSDYVQGDPAGKRFFGDIYWYVHFFNRWGAAMQACPDKFLLLRYEDIQQNPAAALNAISSHYKLGLSKAAIAAALPYVERDTLAARLDPNFNETIIPAADARTGIAFSGADKAQLRATLARHLRYDLGYADMFK